MQDKVLLDILNQWNPWNRELDSGIRRDHYLKKIMPYMERNEILVLKGIRRCGKSTILKQLINELIDTGIDKTQILNVNFDDYRFKTNSSLDFLDTVFEFYKKSIKPRKRIYFFIDEIQNIENWERFLKTKYDQGKDIKFIITGSNASLLSQELSTLLTGRNISFQIMPLSFKEYQAFSKEGLQDYLRFGGFPEVVLEKSVEKKVTLLQEYFDNIINRDIITRHCIRNAKQLRDIAVSLVSSSGAKVSLNKLSKIFGLSRDTISLYINYMIDSFLLYEVNYFSYSIRVRHDVTKLPKLYVRDTGFLNITSMNFSENKGRLYENAVLIKLLEKYKQISYWSELRSEIDFVVDKNIINVTATDQIPKREYKGFDDFEKKNKGFKRILITDSTDNKECVSFENFLAE
jgi:hypothetical protein